jgi:hypothetical protein
MNGTEDTAMSDADVLIAPIPGAECREVGGVQLDIVPSGEGRVKRVIYPPGWRWSTHMKPVTRTDLCMHTHVGFLARGRVHVEYGDGCVVELTAPQVVTIAPGHDSWVVGNEPAVLIEFDFERESAKRLGVAAAHLHTTTR